VMKGQGKSDWGIGGPASKIWKSRWRKSLPARGNSQPAAACRRFRSALK